MSGVCWTRIPSRSVTWPRLTSIVESTTSGATDWPGDNNQSQLTNQITTNHTSFTMSRSYLNVRHLMENDQDDDRNIVKKGKRQRRKKQRSGDYVDNDHSSYNYDDEDPYGEDFLRVDNIQFGNYLCPSLVNVSFYWSVAPDKLSLSPRRHQVNHRSYSPTYVEPSKPKLSYRERYELEHTYAAQRGGRHFKQRARFGIYIYLISYNDES